MDVSGEAMRAEAQGDAVEEGREGGAASLGLFQRLSMTQCGESTQRLLLRIEELHVTMQPGFLTKERTLESVTLLENMCS